MQTPPSESEQKAFEQLRRLLADRAPSYEAGVQTTVLGARQGGWGNLLTVFDFIDFDTLNWPLLIV